ncbi:MAG: 16S rRNA (adenine(1518)-N(6)/adenine(1519)-N(6))-dimethyltransferase RsmA [Oscillospiraceae bacterium]|nr:16S rRNA (adenine(1518)-N(6)/adenine(1519)-N(6))-dimethyltransferase RsmA [Oscillospiraceae bacterium]
MELTNINDLRSLLGSHGFHFSKAMGQNFLIEAWVPERIAEESGADENSAMLEIGPGVGCLTRELALRAAAVKSVELDKRLLPVLAETVGAFDNVEIIPGDIMKLDLNSIDFASLTPRVCANLPYNITSPVVTKLLESGIFASLTVMVQREVADRITAKPGTAEYGAFTVLCGYYAETRKLFNVPSSCFEPRPKVESAVVRLDTRRIDLKCDEALFWRIVRGAFNQRRKTLVNALSSALPNPKDEIAAAIEGAGLSPTVRGEALGIEEFAEIAKRL